MEMPIKIQKTPFFSKENFILLDKALSIERKEVSFLYKLKTNCPAKVTKHVHWLPIST